MGFLSRRPKAELRFSFDELWAQMQSFGYNGLTYPLHPTQTLQNAVAEVSQSYGGYANGLFKANPIVFACVLVRMLLFSEARFQFQRLRAGRPGDLFGTSELDILEQPWTNATTGDLLSRALLDADLEGNFYAYRRGNRLIRMRPDWVAIVLGVPRDAVDDLDVEIAGYQYHPGGYHSGKDPVSMLPESVVHFAPIPDPDARYRGMSWLTPIVREVQADSTMTAHKLKFFEQGATPNMVVKLDPLIGLDQFKAWVELFREQSDGVSNAYKTLFLGGGADATVVGKDMQQLEFKQSQGAGETRIAAAAGVPPVIVGLSEGLQAATYSNYAQARRRFADGTMRPLWRNMAGSLGTVLRVPADARLWYDDRDIPFLQEDKELAATIQSTQANAMRQLIDAGYEPESVISAITNNDWTRLTHTGLFSAQLMPPGTMATPPTSNGKPPAPTPVPV